MKRAIFPSVVIVLVVLVCSCNRNKEEVYTTSDGIKYVKLSPQAGSNSGNSDAYKSYEITDPGIQSMSAIILQIPSGWQAENSFTRIWNGSTPINQVYVKTGDAKSSVEILPYAPYYYVDGPTTNSLRQTSQSMGYPQQYQPFELPPMEPLNYIKQVILPRLRQKGISIQISREQNLGSQNQFKGVRGSKHAYIDGQLPNGKNVRIECGIILNAKNAGGETYYNWSAFPAIITADDLDAGYAVLKHMRSTVLYNPEWEQKVNQLTQKGNAANAQIAQKDYENVKAYQQAIQQIHQGVTDDRNASNERNNESFGDVISGQGKFENTTTGERVKLDDQYKYYYSDKQGNYYASDEPLDYKTMNWTEVKRLDTKDY